MDILNSILDFGKENVVWGLVGTLGLFFIKRVRTGTRNLGRLASTALRKKNKKLEELVEAGADKVVEAAQEFRDGMKEDNK